MFFSKHYCIFFSGSLENIIWTRVNWISVDFKDSAGCNSALNCFITFWQPIFVFLKLKCLILPWTYYQMDLAYQLFNISWDVPSHSEESWERFKRRVARIMCLSSSAKFDWSLYFYFYERKQNKWVHVLYCDIFTIKEDCCWLNFLKTKYSV